MKIRKIAAAVGVVGAHRNNRHYRVRRPNSRACPNLRPDVACYLGTGINPAASFGSANPDGLRAGRQHCYMTVNEGYQLTIGVLVTSDCTADARIVQSTLDEASPGDTVTPNTGPPAGAQPMCGGQISLFGQSIGDGEAYS